MEKEAAETKSEFVDPFKIPDEETIPAISSGLVSWRTRIHEIPFSPISTASSAENANIPLAAPGEAGSPCARNISFGPGLILGCNS